MEQQKTLSKLSGTIRPRLTWSLTEIAEATGLSVNFLRLEERRGNLRTVKFGRRVLVRDEDLRDYVRTGSSGAHDEGDLRRDSG